MRWLRWLNTFKKKKKKTHALIIINDSTYVIAVEHTQNIVLLISDLLNENVMFLRESHTHETENIWSIYNNVTC
jgi:hypothetical protein